MRETAFSRILVFLIAFALAVPAIGQSGNSSGSTSGSTSNDASSQQQQAPPSDTAKPAADSGGYGPEPGAPHYPGIGPSKKKLEATLGSFNLRVYGTVLMNVSVSDSAEVGQETPLWPLPGGSRVTFPDGTSKPAGQIHDTILSARQSVFGFIVKREELGGWVPSGHIEFDFFGSRPVDTLQPQGREFNQPRLRLGFFQIAKDEWTITAGQDKAIVAPLDPISLSHVAVPLGATAGNLWAWLPQVRAGWNKKFGSTSTLLQVGVLRPQFGDPRLNDLPAPGSAVDSTSSGLGERSSNPFYEARFAVSHPMAHGNSGTVGVGVHYGKEKIGANRDFDSWAAAADWELPVASHLILRGEAYGGSNLVPFQGGVLQGIALFQPVTTSPPQRIQKIGDAGGWGELVLPVTTDNHNVFYAGAGTDDPRDRNLLPGSTRSKNSFAWASFFHKLNDNITVAAEWSNWQFRTRTFVGANLGGKGASGRGNVIDASFAFQF
jgi:hypothetical protein